MLNSNGIFFKLMQKAVSIIGIVCLLSSCGASKLNHERRLLLKGIDSINNSAYQYPQWIVQKGDLLTILVFSDNIEATAIYNQSQTGGTLGASAAINDARGLSANGKGYLVDKDGYIFFHSLGLIKIAGLSKDSVSARITEGLRKYLQNPYVVVRYTNAKITVLGDVVKPGEIELPDQKMSVLDAIGLSGDFTPFANRENVVIVREVNGKREVGHLNFTSANLYASPYFYLQQNDMVYVEPNRKKPTGNEQVLMRNITIATSVISILVLLTTLLTR